MIKWAAESDGSPESDRLDILGIDGEGQLVVAELKREKSGRNVHLQAITYAALVATFDLETLADEYSKFWNKRGQKVSPEDAQKLILDHVGGTLDPAILRRPRMVLLAQKFAKQVTHSAVWLSEMGLNVELIRLSVWRIDGGVKLVGFTKIYPTPQVEELTLAPARKEAKAVEEGLQERRRSARSVNQIVAAHILPHGTRLRMKPKQGGTLAARTRIEAWMADDEKRSIAIWQNEKSKPLKWAVDDNRYAPSRLAQHIFELVEETDAPSLQGTAW